MGWKNVKEHYRIGHTVQITPEGLCIGSPYIHNIMVIGLDGVFKKRYDMSRSNEDLCRYQEEMDADPTKLRELIATPDTFAESMTVYTYDGGEIVEKKCEVGPTRVTHDGAMMYNNTFSEDRAKVVEWAKSNASAGIKCYRQRVEEIASDLLRVKALLEKEEANLAKLNADYPDT